MNAKSKVLCAGMTMIAIAGIFLACGKTVQKAKPEIVLSVETDVALPDSVDTVRIEVLTANVLQFGSDYQVGPGQTLIPATLGVLQGTDPATPVLIRMIAKKKNVTKMIREVTTTIPPRVALLRLPIRWLCDESGTTSICAKGTTCIAGDCVDSNIDSSTLPEFSEGDVFGGGGANGGGACFDVLGCMAGGAPATPDPASCTIAKPAGASPAQVNVALEVTNDGVCDAAKTSCFVVVDQATPDGWQDVGGDRIKLPNAVCTRLASGRVKNIVTAQKCPTKTPKSPVCGAWSSVGGGPPATPPIDAGVPTFVSKPGSQISAANDLGCKLQIQNNQLIYCLQPGFGNTNQIWSQPLDGSPAPTSPIVEVQYQVRGPLISSDGIYWIDTYVDPAKFYKKTFDSAPATLISTFSPPYSKNVVTMDGTTWFQTTESNNAGQPKPVYGIPKNGGAYTQLVGALSNSDFTPVKAVADNDPNGFLYVVTTGTFAGFTAAASIEKISKLAVDAGPPQTFPTTGGSLDAVLDGDNLYVATYQSDGIRANINRVALAGTGQVIATTPGFFYNFAIDDTFLYWIAGTAAQNGNRALFRILKAGGAAEEVPVLAPAGTVLESVVATADKLYVAASHGGGEDEIAGHIIEIKKK